MRVHLFFIVLMGIHGWLFCMEMPRAVSGSDAEMSRYNNVRYTTIYNGDRGVQRTTFERTVVLDTVAAFLNQPINSMPPQFFSELAVGTFLTFGVNVMLMLVYFFRQMPESVCSYEMRIAMAVLFHFCIFYRLLGSEAPRIMYF